MRENKARENGNKTTSQSADEEENDLTPFQQGLPQFLAVGVKNILLLGYGMTLGFPTIIIPAIMGGEGREASIHGEIVLNKDQISWFSSINLICVPVGCIFSGALAQPFGRRRAMQIINVPFMTAWILFYFSSNIYHLYAGLCFAGLSGGFLEAPVLTYVAEVTQPRFRGMLSATGSTFSILGVFSMFLLGTFLPWRTIALCSMTVPIISTIALFFVPESPHWLIKKGRFDDAKKSLAWLRGWVPIKKIEAEYQTLYDSIVNLDDNEKPTCSETLKLYRKKSFLGPYALIVLTFFIGHFSGMTTLQTYAVQIFHTLKAPIDKYYATMLLGICELLGTLTCVILVHFTGKRPLVLMSAIGCGFCFLGTATYAYFIESIPGTAVSNIVANSSALDLKHYISIIPVNDTDDYDFDENMDMLTEYPIFNVTDWENNDYENPFNEENSTSIDNIYDGFENNFEISHFSVNYSDGHFTQKLKNYTFDSDADVSVIPNIFVEIPKHREQNKYLWLPLTLLLGSAYLSHAGIRLIPWMLIGELYPTSVRHVATGLSGGSGYIFGFLANKLFLKMLANLTLPGTYWLYSSISLLGALILYFVLPETEGRTLAEIQGHFSGGKKLGDKNKIEMVNLPVNHDRILTTTPKNNSHPMKNNDIRSRKVSSKQHFNVDSWDSNLRFQNYMEQHNNVIKNKMTPIMEVKSSTENLGDDESQTTHF